MKYKLRSEYRIKRIQEEIGSEGRGSGGYFLQFISGRGCKIYSIVPT